MTLGPSFSPLALSGQCIVDCQQCTVGSGPVVGLKCLHVSVDEKLGLSLLGLLQRVIPWSATRGSCLCEVN